LVSSVDEEIRTVKALLKGSFFKKVHQDAPVIFLVFETYFEEEERS
jgi:hypothetical protein